jgi:UDP-N-acetylmuramoyl-tripeptide--D-alanyl-D-alanine ligase
MFPGVCIAIPHRRDNGKQFSMRRSTLMEPRTLQYMAQAANGEQLTGSQEAVVQRVCTDSRQARPGDLFVALQGERFDGHDFLEAAARLGVTGVIAQRGRLPHLASCAAIAVDNPRWALGRMAAAYRRDFQIPLVAVAGSNGKTTIKEIIASVLRQQFKTLASPASFNNDVGVPATLLELSAEHQAAVLEFGTNHPGELAPLLRMAQPTLGVITSIGREHLEFFGDLNGVIEEEGWLAELLPASGKLFLNADTPGADAILRRSSAPVVRVGLREGLDWRAVRLESDERGVGFAVESSRQEFCRTFRTPLLGRHQAVNSLLAIAVGAELGITPEQAQRGLLNCTPPKMRLQLWQWRGVNVLDDSYNANADSTRVALETLRDYPCAGRRVAVLGDMAELGDHAASAHAEIGRYAVSTGVQHLVAVGSMASLTAQSAKEAGLRSVEACQEIGEAAEALRRNLRPDDVVLLKASRVTGLDKLGELLRAQDSPAPDHELGQCRNRLGNE